MSGQLAINPPQSLSFRLTIGRQFYAHFTSTLLFIPSASPQAFTFFGGLGNYTSR